MLNRRRFLQSIVAAATTPSLLQGCTPVFAEPIRGEGLVTDPDGILDLADGLGYRVISKKGRRMSDGLRVPGNHDGMAAFPGPGGRIVLVPLADLLLSDEGQRLVETASGVVMEVRLRARKNSRARCSSCALHAPGYDMLSERRFEFVPLWGIQVFFLYVMWPNTPGHPVKG